MNITDQELLRIIRVLRPFAEMDREGCELDEQTCARGTASDLTILTSRNFRHARTLLDILTTKLEPLIECPNCLCPVEKIPHCMSDEEWEAYVDAELAKQTPEERDRNGLDDWLS